MKIDVVRESTGVYKITPHDGERMDPERPQKLGNIFVLFQDGEPIGWRESPDEKEVLCFAFHNPENSRYKAILWEHCKFSHLEKALDQGRIEGKITSGCDCLESRTSRARIAELLLFLEETKKTISDLKNENLRLIESSKSKEEKSPHDSETIVLIESIDKTLY